MMDATNPIYNFMLEMYDDYSEREYVTLASIFSEYRKYAEASELSWVMPKHKFKLEVKHYFKEFHERYRVNGTRPRNVFSGFRTELFESGDLVAQPAEEDAWLGLKAMNHTTFDDIFENQPAQYT